MLKIVAVGAVLIGTDALAQAPAETQNRTAPTNDLNQIVCVNERETGSRVSTRRVCRTRAEWAAYEAQMRQNVNRVQTFNPVICPETGARNKC